MEGEAGVSDVQAAPDAAGLYGRLERIAMVVGAAVMLAIVACSVLIAGRTDADLSEAAQSQLIRAATVDLMQAVTSAESGQRGYLLTGKEDYLVPYRAAAARVPRLKAELAGRLPNDPDLAQGFPVIDAKMAELAETIRLGLAGQRSAALALVQSDQGQRDMDAIAGLVETMARRQRMVLGADLARSQAGARLSVTVDAVAFLVLAGLVLFVVRGARRGFAELSAAQASLRAANIELEAGSERLERAVVERTADLTEANAEIQRFAYIVSHDLRAPLLNIIGFTAELEVATSRLNAFVGANLADVAVPQEVREASEEDLPEAIRFIQASTTKMDRLITAILRLSREGRRVLTPERLDMAALLAGVADSVRHQMDAAGAEIVIGKLPAVVSDRVALEQVFSNLIENALKYGEPSRPVRIAISGARRGASVVITVKDNGRGILPRDRERVFELFRRAGNQDQPGEGIGLAHVRALARRLGGTIDCASTFGEGSSFMVTLPADGQAVAFAQGPADPGDDAAFGET
jgi:signal transduction histidine kinase